MSQYKRKYDGPPVRELRRVDQDPLRVPPHKKPRKYRMTVKYTTLTTVSYTKEFVSKEAMREFRARTERNIAEHKAAAGKPRRGFWSLRYDLKMEREESTEFKTGPDISEEMIEG